MPKNLTHPVIFPVLLFAFLIQIARAQVTTATISGLIKDESDAVLPSVTVRIKNTDTGIARTAVTDDQGRYHVPNLPLGNYEVQAELPGFQTAVRSGIKLTVGREAIVDFTLKVGEITEKVTVTGEAPLIETTTSDISGLVAEQEIKELPLNGRSFEQLATLQTGVNVMPYVRKSENVGQATFMSVAGGRVDSNSYVLDGTDINDYGNTTPGSVAGNMMGVDMIREFKVLTHNFSAEYGRSAGAVINVITKSGTNDLHGSAFGFLRNDNLDARNFFDLAKPEFKRNQFGASAGGPIVRNKTFFFAGYEGLRERLGTTNRTAVPDANAHNGLLPDLSSPGKLVFVGVDPKVKPYLDLFPLPNGRLFDDGTGELIFNFDGRTNEDYLMVRIDHQFSQSHSFYGRYTFDDAETFFPRPLPIFEDFRTSRAQYLTLSETSLFGPTVINTLTFAFNRSNPATDSRPTVELDPSLFFVPGAGMGTIRFTETAAAAQAVGGIGEFGFNNRAGGNPLQNTFQVVDHVSLVRGPHSIRLGGNVERFQLNVANPPVRGSWIFRDLRAFLTNRPSSGTGPGPSRDLKDYFRQVLVAGYLQDDIQLRQNFTLNLGLRYEFLTIPTEINGKIGNLLKLSDTEPALGVWTPDAKRKTFQPRLGFSWDPTSRGKMAIRAGFGVFHNHVLGRHFGLIAANNAKDTSRTGRNPTHFPDATRFTQSGQRGGIHFEPDYQTPTMYHYNLNYQLEISPGTVVSLGYVGSSGRHLINAWEGNRNLPVVQADGSLFFPATAPRRNPAFDNIQARTADANSFYNSLQFGARGRQKGLRYQVSYTFGKSIDDASNTDSADALNNPNRVMNPDNRVGDRGLSAFDVRHRFVANWSYDLPGQWAGLAGKIFSGWQISGILTLASGLPMTPIVGFNVSRDGNSSAPDRPVLKPGSDNNPHLGTPERWFDPLAFLPPMAGTYGNLGRNTVIAPGLANLDAALVKNFAIAENKNLSFRCEFFNLLNRANFGLPASAIFTTAGLIRGTVGRITDTTTTSRQIQFALKFTF